MILFILGTGFECSFKGSKSVETIPTERDGLVWDYVWYFKKQEGGSTVDISRARLRLSACTPSDKTF